MGVNPTGAGGAPGTRTLSFPILGRKDVGAFADASLALSLREC